VEAELLMGDVPPQVARTVRVSARFVLPVLAGAW
jgi:hypothetical protein